jgi:carboxypeptidase family protein
MGQSTKHKGPDNDPAVKSAQITSRRTLVGVMITAIVAATATISAAVISKGCGPSTDPPPSPTPLSFSGRVTDKNTEERIKGAKVSLEAEGAPPLAYTDSQGIFTFPISDPSKELRLRIEADRYENYDLRVTPAKNQGIQDIRLTLEAAPALSGRVVDLNGRPIQGAKVTLDDPLRLQPVETSSDGIFTLKEIPRKSGEFVRVRVTREGYTPYTIDVVLDRAPPKIILTRKR